MSGKLPLFASAPRSSIYINNQKVAYAVGLDLNVSVNLQEIRILGEFAVQSIEPLAYLPVSGSFQIVRLLSSASQTAYKTAGTALQNELTGAPGDANLADVVALNNSVPNTGNSFSQALLFRHLDPRTALLSQSFDIEIKLKVPVVSNLTDPNTNYTIPTSAPFDVEEAFLLVKDCRLVSSSANVAPNQLLTQSLEFQGLLMINQARPGIKEASDSTFREGVVG
jgi:hypothetical protein